MNCKQILSTALAAVLTAFAATTISSCGGGDAVTQQTDSALALKARVDSAMAAGQYSEAVSLIDTISKRYPLATEVRKSLIPVRAKAMEDSIVKAIPQLDLSIANLKGVIDTERARFVTQTTSSNFPPVLVYRGTQGPMTGSARIQARVSTGDEEELNPWCLAVSAGKNIGMSSLQVVTRSGEQFTIAVPASEYEQATVPMEDVTPLARQLADNGDVITSMTASGSHGTARIPVSAVQSDGLAAAYRLVTARDSLRSLMMLREKAERILQLARDQSVN